MESGKATDMGIDEVLWDFFSTKNIYINQVMKRVGSR
jgi:hypothetical protein